MTVYARSIGGARSNGLPAAAYRYRGIPGWNPAAAPPGRRQGGPEAAAERIRAGGCGSPTGYTSHRRRGEQPCQPCIDARNAYRRARRAEGGNP